MDLAELFPDGEHRFQLTLRRAEPREFFAPRDETGRVLAERRRWLEADAARYARLEPAGEPLLREFLAMAADWKLILPYLQENERLFGIRIDRDLLTVDGIPASPQVVYRKVLPRKDAEIEAELEGMGD